MLARVSTLIWAEYFYNDFTLYRRVGRVSILWCKACWKISPQSQSPQNVVGISWDLVGMYPVLGSMCKLQFTREFTYNSGGVAVFPYTTLSHTPR